MKKNINKRIFFAAFVFLFFIALNFFYHQYVINIKSKNETVIKKVEQQIQRKEKIAEKVLNELIQDSAQKKPQEIFLNENIQKLSEKESITFLVYENDTLVFWTDNIFSSPVLFENNIPAQKIVRTENGWYYLIRKKAHSKKCFAAILIKNEYKYENDYLANDFTRDIRLDVAGTGISENTKANVIKNSENQKLFSLTFKEKTTYTPTEQIIILTFYFLAFFSLIFLLFQIFRVLSLKKHIGKKTCTLVFIFTLVLIRAVLFYFKLPENIYATDFFGPLFYASSGFLPSLGDLLINTILFFVITVFVYKKAPYEPSHIQKNWMKMLLVLIIISFLAVSFMFVVSLIQSVILDSTISYNLSQLFSINGLSIIGLLIVSLLVLSYFLIAVVLLQLCIKFKLNISYCLILILLNGIFYAKVNLFGLISSYPAAICFVLFCTLYVLSRQKRETFHYYEILAYLIIFTFATYNTFNDSNSSKELERRKSLAHKLSSGEDPLAENIYKDVQKQIAEDKFLKIKLAEYPQSEFEVKEYLTKKYFSGYWDKYKVQITVCNALDSLVVEAGPEKQNCKMFFEDLVNTYGKPASCKDLYALNYGTGGNNYLSTFDFVIDSAQLYLFIELNSKFIPKGLGYPELLIDKKLFIDTDLSNYSYAKYYKNGLIDAYGKYYYSTNYSINDSLFVNNFYIYNANGYNHLCYKSDKSSIILISKKSGNIFDIIAPFSILFIIFSVVILIFSLFEIFLPNLRTIRFDFKNRLQISMVSIILVSFLIIGVVTLYFIRNLNENKNLDLLSEKSMSILQELQSKVGDNDTLDEERLAVLNAALIKFSNVFFTDINVFDTTGRLVSSSRPQIFNEGLLSGRINPRAFSQLLAQKKTLFIQKENIGKLNYYSAYALFYGRNSKVLYYINLPYFAKEGELKRELSSFLTAFINIYVILIAITILIALFISGRITRPLNVIKDKLSSIKLGKKNEKIIWTRRDEIGGLISEYNRMIDELAASAESLSRSEREGAWRVMAMQVAHEIKNPLTPMKLSVQHLERSWKDQAPDWGEKLEHFTKNIIEQIENLAAIASEFSYFAQMPKPQNERINLATLVANATSLFMTGTGVRILFNKEATPKNCVVFADKKQLIRVMNNILTNAIQAIGSQKDGLIEIQIEKTEHHAIISIKDNGSGISDEMKPKMFTPNFSTKSEGMGLGLAIVKGIIENSNGKIWFESEKEIGTTFFIQLPLAE